MDPPEQVGGRDARNNERHVRGRRRDGEPAELLSVAVDEILVVIEGELELEMQGLTFRPAIGQEVLISAHIPHSVRNVSGTTAWRLYGSKG